MIIRDDIEEYCSVVGGSNVTFFDKIACRAQRNAEVFPSKSLARRLKQRTGQRAEDRCIIIIPPCLLDAFIIFMQ